MPAQWLNVLHTEIIDRKISKACLESLINAPEARLLERVIRLDRGVLNSRLSPDFVERGANGIAWNRIQIIDALLAQDLYNVRSTIFIFASSPKRWCWPPIGALSGV